MDHPGPSPSKRPRNGDSIHLQIKERILPFKLSQQYPSTIFGTVKKPTPIENIKLKGKQALNIVPMGPFTNSMKFVPNKEANISNKMQKLKLKSQDGRDLGEINVKLLPQKGDSIGGKTITLTKHSVFRKTEKPIGFSLLRLSDNSRAENKTAQLPVQVPVVEGTCGSVSPSVSPHSTQSQETNSGNANGDHLAKFGSENIERERSSNEDRISPAHHALVQMPIGSPVTSENSDTNECQNTGSNHTNKTTLKNLQTAATTHKVIVVHPEKQSGMSNIQNLQNIERDVRNSANIPLNHKLVILRPENYAQLTGNKNISIGNAVNTVQSTASKKEKKFVLQNSIPNSSNLPNISLTSEEFAEFMSKLTKHRANANQSELDDKGKATVNNKPHKKSRRTSETINKTTNVETQSFVCKNLKTYSRKDARNVENRESRTDSALVQNTMTKLETTSRASQESSPKNYASSEDNDETIFYTVRDDHVDTSTQQTQKTIVHPDDNTSKCSKSSKENSNNEQTNVNFGKNVMVIVHRDLTEETSRPEKNLIDIDDNKRKKSIAPGDTSTVIQDNTKSTGANTNVVQNNEKESEINTTISPENATEKDMACSLDILQKALSSVTDQELRDKALKALLDCGIGVERQVPVRPPPDMMSVHDTQTQTKVFGMLEPENFVTVKEDSPEILRMNEIEKIYQLPFQSTVSPSSQQHLLGNENLVIPASCSPFNMDIDIDILDQFLITNLGPEATKINKVLSKPNPVVDKAYTELMRDYQTVKVWDENGLLNIHKAVINGSFQQVKRQLLVLKACKESVELLTGDGKTSLELAVQFEVDPQIVKLLLQAGAQPASLLRVHDSALIIACKMSSVVLPDLVNSVQHSNLLDAMDSEGFAPLHYCAQRGNMIGIQALVNGHANVNLRDGRSGRSPLFHCLESSHIDIAHYLLDHGAISNTPNFAGQTALALMDELRNQTLIECMNRAIKSE